jgi:hypothetical protein
MHQVKYIGEYGWPSRFILKGHGKSSRSVWKKQAVSAETVQKFLALAHPKYCG